MNGIVTTTGDLVLAAVYRVPVTDVHTATYFAEPDQPLIFDAVKLTFNDLSLTEIFMPVGACGRLDGISYIATVPESSYETMTKAVAVGLSIGCTNITPSGDTSPAVAVALPVTMLPVGIDVLM